jgi:hypothetical protein
MQFSVTPLRAFGSILPIIYSQRKSARHFSNTWFGKNAGIPIDTSNFFIAVNFQRDADNFRVIPMPFAVSHDRSSGVKK